MAIFLTGSQGQGTDQPTTPTLMAVPEVDGTSQGLENTVAALVYNVRQLSGQKPDTGSNSASTKKQPTKGQTGRFVEISRATQSVTVSDPTSGASVTFEQITQLVMQDTVTGEQWTWNL
jgi:hypothetical protein